MQTQKIVYLGLAVILISACRPQKYTPPATPLLTGQYASAQPEDSTSRTPPSLKQMVFDTTLTRLIDSALGRNFNLLEAYQRVEMARAGFRYTKGLRLPEINAAGSAGLRKFGHYTMDGIGNYDTKFSPNLNKNEFIPDPLPDYFLGLQSSWEIDLWGKLKSKKRAALSRFIASEHGKNLILTNLVAEVSETYFELIAVTNELIILEDNIELQQDAVEVISAQMQTGKANQLGVDMMQAQLLNSRSIYVETNQRKIEYTNKLNFLCGGSFPDLIHDSLFRQNYVEDSLLSGIPSDLLRNRPDIRQAEMELIASHADVASAKAAFYPSFTINAGVGFQAFNTAFLLDAPASVAYNLIGGLSAPLLNRRRIKADLMMAEAEKKRAYIGYEKTVYNGFLEVFNSLASIQTTKQTLSLKMQEAEIFRNSVSTSSELFKAGRAGYLEVILSQRNALQSQLELVAAKKRQQQAAIRLYRSMGGGWQ